jgi:hypothetical protein
MIALEPVQVIEVTKDIIAALFERNPHLVQRRRRSRRAHRRHVERSTISTR